MTPKDVEDVSVALLKALGMPTVTWRDLQKRNGLSRAECELLLYANDVAMYYYGEKAFGDKFVPPYRALTPHNLATAPTEVLISEAHNAFGEFNRANYSDADRRVIYLRLLKRKQETEPDLELPQCVVEFYDDPMWADVEFVPGVRISGPRRGDTTVKVSLDTMKKIMASGKVNVRCQEPPYKSKPKEIIEQFDNEEVKQDGPQFCHYDANDNSIWFVGIPGSASYTVVPK